MRLFIGERLIKSQYTNRKGFLTLFRIKMWKEKFIKFEYQAIKQEEC